MQKIKYLSFN